MTNSIDFLARFLGSWADCHSPDAEDGDTVVNYDQANLAYRVDVGEAEEFVEWVARVWEADTDPREDGETAQEYLDRRDITIRQVVA